jgi:hypothetical protein
MTTTWEAPLLMLTLKGLCEMFVLWLSTIHLESICIAVLLQINEDNSSVDIPTKLSKVMSFALKIKGFKKKG